MTTTTNQIDAMAKADRLFLARVANILRAKGLPATEDTVAVAMAEAMDEQRATLAKLQANPAAREAAAEYITRKTYDMARGGR